MGVQLPVVLPRGGDWRPPRVAELPSWKGCRRVGLDLETCDPQLKRLGPGVRRDGYIVGVSFAMEDGPAHYLPFGHAGGDNLERAKVISYLEDQAGEFTGDIVGANLQYDLDYLAQAGVVFRRARFFRDVQVAEPLLDENQFSYSLDNIALRHGLQGKSEELLKVAAERFKVDAKAEMWKLPARFVGPYAIQDARLPLNLLAEQERMLEDQGLWGIWDIESRLLPVLIKMRRRGVRINEDQLDIMEAKAIREEETALKEFSRLSGVEVSRADLNRPTVIGRALMALGVSKPKRSPKSQQVQIKADVLRSYNLPAIDHYLRARQFRKISNDFVNSIRDHMVDGRIHTTFNQLKMERNEGGSGGTVSGRLSSTGPNLQQQPARHPEIGKDWRAIYVPEEGCEWACADFSQQEPRWVVHYAEITGCPGAKAAAEQYRNDPNTDFHNMVCEMLGWDTTCKETRGRVKAIGLGLFYGMGGAKLCDSLGLPTDWWDAPSGKKVRVAGREGKAILDEYHYKVPFVKALSTKAMDRAKAIGRIKTVLGRVCRFEMDDKGGFKFTHKGLSRLIQGSSADQTKKAMVDADDAGLRLQLQVHDELDMSIENRQQGEHLAEVMRDAVPCNVPARVDLETGPDWGHIQ